MKSYLVGLVIVLSLLAQHASANSFGEVWGEGTWPQGPPAQIMVTPQGTGDAFTNAHLAYGVTTDASIHIQLWYEGGSIEFPEPAGTVAGFPAEDIWLEAPGLAFCLGGTTADANTDANGWFTFTEPMHAGGSTGTGGGLEALRIYISGMELSDNTGAMILPAIVFNSPDIDGDGSVALPDISLFAGDLNSSYNFRSDFNGDGLISLPDVARLSASLGQQCP